MGKVTVKHFLNKKLKPIYNGYTKETLNTPYYPLYHTTVQKESEAQNLVVRVETKTTSYAHSLIE